LKQIWNAPALKLIHQSHADPCNYSYPRRTEGLTCPSLAQPPKQIKTPASIKKASKQMATMPSEISEPEKFIEISTRAEYCAVKRLKDVVKLKLRTAGNLYTLKVEPMKAEELIKKLQCEIREV